jgi:hypothetical protein
VGGLAGHGLSSARLHLSSKKLGFGLQLAGFGKPVAVIGRMRLTGVRRGPIAVAGSPVFPYWD